MVFETDLVLKEKKEDILRSLEKIQEKNEEFFNKASFLEGLDLADPTNEMEILSRIQQHQKEPAWWGYMAAGLNYMAAQAVKAGDAALAAWAAACGERFRSLAVFEVNFADTVLMGNSAVRLIQLLHIWDANRNNADEGFWQHILSEHTYAFSQLFSVPVTFIEGTAYVGGTQLDGKDARYLDFMLSGGSANHAILVEIKTPRTALLGGKYRGNVFPPSKDLGGGVIQINDYCDVLRRNIENITRERDLELNTFNPRRIVLIGNYAEELTTPKKRSSFELFRSSLAGVEIVTFDEFFKKVEDLATLFNLTRSQAPL